MKSILAFALGALAGIFGFQKHQEGINGKKFDSKRTGNAAIEITKEDVNDAETNAAEAAKTPKEEKQEEKKRTKVLGVIPARYASTRFPGKPLVMIAGKPMIVRTYLQAKKATQLDALVVATDDERIRDAIVKAGGDVVMTDEAIPNGTERCAQACERTAGEYDIVVNIQGDEPLIEPEIIDEVVLALKNAPRECVYSTPVTPLKHEEVKMQGRVKCITDVNGYAIYFSRGMLPNNKKGEVDTSFDYWLHLGLQCYDREFLKLFPKMPATPMQMQEDLEQLKVIENGYKIKVIRVNHCAHGVDEPEDVASIEKIIAEDPSLD
tara:strand:- start:1397 stop:2362 length:966 start_codon:yes stop_codon:yes gene_type:complete